MTVSHRRAMYEAADTRERLLRLAIPYTQVELTLTNGQTQQVMLSLPQVRVQHCKCYASCSR